MPSGGLLLVRPEIGRRRRRQRIEHMMVQTSQFICFPMSYYDDDVECLLAEICIGECIAAPVICCEFVSRERERERVTMQMSKCHWRKMHSSKIERESIIDFPYQKTHAHTSTGQQVHQELLSSLNVTLSRCTKCIHVWTDQWAMDKEFRRNIVGIFELYTHLRQCVCIW